MSKFPPLADRNLMASARRVGSFLLSAVLAMSIASPALADTVTTAGANSSIPVQVSSTAPNFSVVLPTALPIAVAADGTVTCAQSGVAKIINNSGGPVDVTDVSMEATNGWTLVAFNTDYSAVPVGSKQFGFQLQGENVPTTGECDASAFDTIDGGDELAITYDATVAVQDTAIESTIANITFVVGWNCPVAQSSPASAIEIGQTIALGSLAINGTPIKTNKAGTKSDNTEFYPKDAALTFGDSGADDETINWVKVADNLLIADRNLLHYISWDNLNDRGYITGVTVTIDGIQYTVRSLTYDEWDTYIVNGPAGTDNETWHWLNCYSWTQRISGSWAYLRGFSSISDNTSQQSNTGVISSGFRPVLQIGS